MGPHSGAWFTERVFVMPADAGIQPVAALDSGVRRNDHPRQPKCAAGLVTPPGRRQNWKPVEKCRRAAPPSRKPTSKFSLKMDATMKKPAPPPTRKRVSERCVPRS